MDKADDATMPGQQRQDQPSRGRYSTSCLALPCLAFPRFLGTRHPSFFFECASQQAPEAPATPATPTSPISIDLREPVFGSYLSKMAAPHARAVLSRSANALRSARLARFANRSSRTLATTPPDFVHVVEVGPRDGLQNEKKSIPVNTKIDLVERLAKTGLRTIEAGSFVSPKWTPQVLSFPGLRSKGDETQWLLTGLCRWRTRRRY
jgi:hypothetical protein